jgi:hypothetical protein
VSLVAAIAGCLGRAPSPAASAKSPPPPPSSGLATWVWDEATVLGVESRRDLLAFARGKGVDALFVHAAVAYDEGAGFEALAELVRGASRQGASVVLVGGDPSWSLPAHHRDALAFLRRAAALETRLAARHLARSERVLFDVEPYLLPEWKESPARTAASYVELLRLLRAEGRAASLDVWHTIPFWFPQIEVGGRSLDGLVLDEAAGIVVMAYRDRADDVQALAAPLLARAERRGRPVIVAVETTCIDPRRVTFCGQTAGQLGLALDHIALGLHASPAFAGLAVHKYASWATLAGGAR